MTGTRGWASGAAAAAADISSPRLALSGFSCHKWHLAPANSCVIHTHTLLAELAGYDVLYGPFFGAPWRTVI